MKWRVDDLWSVNEEACVSAPRDASISVGMRLRDDSDHDVLAKRVSYGHFGVVAFGPDRRNEDRVTALKSLRASLLYRPNVYERFIDDGLLWMGLWPHPNIVRVYGVAMMADAERSARPFIAMESEGQGTLRDWLNHGRLSHEVALAWAQCVAAGLTYLHEPDPAYLRTTALAHRDLKPEHVQIKTSGVAALTDFGLSRVLAESARAEHLLPFVDVNAAPTETQALQTPAGVMLGTPAYMAPEQWTSARAVGAPADVYALGVMLYELLVGRHPLLDLERRHSQLEWRLAHERQAPQPLQALDTNLPEALEALALACLAKDPAKRPGARAVWDQLRWVARSLGAPLWDAPETVTHIPYNELVYWSNWSNAHTYFERWDEALERNDRARALNPQATPTLRTRGDIFVGLQRYDEAEAFYQAALLHATTDDERGSVWGQLGAMHNEAGYDALAEGNHAAAIARCEQADAAFAKQVKLAPHDADANFNRAVNQRLWAVAEEERGQIAAAVEQLNLAEFYASDAARLGDTAAWEYEQTITEHLQQLKESDMLVKTDP
jgi:serine/threonine protein kinase